MFPISGKEESRRLPPDSTRRNRDDGRFRESASIDSENDTQFLPGLPNALANGYLAGNADPNSRQQLVHHAPNAMPPRRMAERWKNHTTSTVPKNRNRCAPIVKAMPGPP